MQPPQPNKVFPSREEWLEGRRGTLGGSDAAAVLGLSKYVSPFELWSLKRGDILDSGPTSMAAEAGLRLEPVIADWYRDTTGYEVYDPGDYALYVHDLHEWMTCTPDRFVRKDDGPWGNLQIKTCSAYRAHEWEKGPPLAYQVQVQHEMAVLGLDWSVVAVLIGGQDFRHFPIKRDERFVAALVEREADFWISLQTGEIPELDGSERTYKALQATTRPNGSSVELDPELWREYQIAKAEAAKADDAAGAARNRICEHLGDAELGAVNGRRVVSWKPNKNGTRVFRPL